MNENKSNNLVKSEWSLRECFKQLRFDKNPSLGACDIRLTMEQQEEICNLVDTEKALHISEADVRRHVIAYTKWLTEQNLTICESADGSTFRSSTIGGKKYTAKELYDKFVYEQSNAKKSNN